MGGGNLTAFLGPMFAGKTEELIRLINREEYAGRTFKVYKPKRDNRYNDTKIVTNHGVSIKAKAILENGYQIITDICDELVDDIYIDEIQFFESSIIEVIRFLNSLGVNIFYAGLSTTSENKPFPFKNANPETGSPHMGDLIAGLHHTEIIVQHAYCTKCQAKAYFTHVLVKKTEAVKIGGKEEYEALCPKCYHKKHPFEPPEYYPEDIKEKVEMLKRFHRWKD